MKFRHVECKETDLLAESSSVGNTLGGPQERGMETFTRSICQEHSREFACAVAVAQEAPTLCLGQGP